MIADTILIIATTIIATIGAAITTTIGTGIILITLILGATIRSTIAIVIVAITMAFTAIIFLETMVGAIGIVLFT
jgi:hypothetical protein